MKTNDIIPQKQLKDKYAMYLRKSRADLEAEAQGEFDTLQKHLEILTDLAVRENYHVTDIYKELVSGDTIESRPKMLESDLHSIIEMVKDPEVPVDAKNEFLKSFIKRIDYDRTDHVSDPQLFITFR